MRLHAAYGNAALFTALVLLALPAGAQVLLHSGAEARIGTGGARSVVHAGGLWLAFFDDGTQVVYRASSDGRSFGPALPASTTPAGHGYSVARHGQRVGLAWAHQAGGTWTLYFREAALGDPLAFGAVETVDSATRLRGHQPALGYSVQGNPFIASLGQGMAYNGTITGCGNVNTVRPNYHARVAGSWQAQGYCNNFTSQPDPTSAAITPAGNRMVASYLVAGLLSGMIADEIGELAEPWKLLQDVTLQQSGQLSIAHDPAIPTRIHTVYLDKNGGIAYAVQDSATTANTATASEWTLLGSPGRSPSLSRGASSGGCFVVHHLAENEIWRRWFKGSIAGLGPQSSVFTASGPLTGLSVELDAPSSPALLWQQGGDIFFGVFPEGPSPQLEVTPSFVALGGTASATVGGFRDPCGDPLPPGTQLTVSTTAGTVEAADLDPQTPGVQIALDPSGQATFAILAPSAPGAATVSVLPVGGGPLAQAPIQFGGEAGTDAGTDDAGTDDAGTDGARTDGGDGPRVFHPGVSCGCSGTTVSWSWAGGFLVLWVASGVSRRRRLGGRGSP